MPTDLWPDHCILIHPFETKQCLLYEYAETLAARTFLKMAQLPFRLEGRANAEFISTTNRVPVLAYDDRVVSGTEAIIEFAAETGRRLSDALVDSEMAELAAHISLIQHVLLNAEMYICWLHEPTVREVTKARYGSVYPWPLNCLLPWLKQREARRHLMVFEWSEKSLTRVLEEVNECCKALSDKLGSEAYFFGNSPTELDAFAFGHLYTILTTELPEIDVASIVRRYSNLVIFCQQIERDYYMGRDEELIGAGNH